MIDPVKLWTDVHPIFAHPHGAANIAMKVQWFVEDDLALAFIKSDRIGMAKVTQWSRAFRLDGAPISIDEERNLYQSWLKYCSGYRIDLIGHAPPHALPRCAPNGVTAVEFGSYCIDLGDSMDILWSRCHSKHRNSIRKAEKDGVSVKFGIDHLDAAISGINETMMRQKLSLVSDKNIDNFVRGLGEERVLIGVAYREGKSQAAIIVPFSKFSAYYSYGGTTHSPSPGSMNLLMWRAIEELKKRNCKKFDFVGARLNPEKGSKYEGIQAFKERFGAQLEVGVLWKKKLSSIGGPTWQILEALRDLAHGRVPKGDIIDQEKSRRRR